MGLFKDMLKEGESLFRDEMALDYEYLPKVLAYREQEQQFLATCIKPMFMNRNGKNLLITGTPGIGKTAATKFVLRDLEEESEDIIPLYVNCWQKNTSFKIFTYLCEELGFKFIQNKKSDELFKMLRDRVNKGAVVFVFDEIDKVEDYDFLYSILEEVHRKSIFLITNYKDWIVHLDMRIKSRLLPETVEFKAYRPEETKGILKSRRDLAFVEGVWTEPAFDLIAKRAQDAGDVRVGLHMLRESGLAAEQESQTKIVIRHVEKVTEKLKEFTRKSKDELSDEENFVLTVVKKNSGKKIGDLFTIYQQDGGKQTYKTFQRKINRLASNGFISLKKLVGGPDGSTSIVEYSIIQKQTADKEVDASALFSDGDSLDKPNPSGNKRLDEF